MFCRFTPLFGIVYLLLNAIYITVFNGKNFENFDYIYPILDWKNDLGIAIGVSFGSIAATFLLSLGFYALSNFRDFIWRTIYLREDLQDLVVQFNTRCTHLQTDFCRTHVIWITLMDIYYNHAYKNINKKFYLIERLVGLKNFSVFFQFFQSLVV